MQISLSEPNAALFLPFPYFPGIFFSFSVALSVNINNVCGAALMQLFFRPFFFLNLLHIVAVAREISANGQGQYLSKYRAVEKASAADTICIHFGPPLIGWKMPHITHTQRVAAAPGGGSASETPITLPNQVAKSFNDAS